MIGAALVPREHGPDLYAVPSPVKVGADILHYFLTIGWRDCDRRTLRCGLYGKYDHETLQRPREFQNH
jgi:hypothetical protein